MGNKVDILSVGGHAADEIAWGMALAKYVNAGKSVALLHCTPGEKGHPTLSPAEYAAQKRQEAQAAAAILGNAPVYFLPYGDGELPVNDDVKFAIADAIRDCKPELILTHWPGSMHKDHTAAHASCPDAIFYAAIAGFARPTLDGSGPSLPHWARSLYHGENWEDHYDFTPELYVEVSEEDVALWEEAMRKYALFRAEWKTFPYIEYYKNLARVRGMEVGTTFACAFAVPDTARRRKVTLF